MTTSPRPGPRLGHHTHSRQSVLPGVAPRGDTSAFEDLRLDQQREALAMMRLWMTEQGHCHAPGSRLLTGQIAHLYVGGVDQFLRDNAALIAEPVSTRTQCADCWTLGMPHVQAMFEIVTGPDSGIRMCLTHADQFVESGYGVAHVYTLHLRPRDGIALCGEPARRPGSHTLDDLEPGAKTALCITCDRTRVRMLTTPSL